MKKKIHVSICIPCYNEEKYIRETIDSVLAQTYKNFTLHVVDNNSTDKTLEIVRSIKDKRIRIHKNKRNIGMFGNMNRCLGIAKTGYLKILCADDVLMNQCLQKQVEALNTHSHVVMTYNKNSIINAKGKKLFTRTAFSSNTKIDGHLLIKKILTSGRNPIGEPSTILFKAEVAAKHMLLFKTSFLYVGDLDMWINILRYGDAYYINETLNSFRVHNNSGSAKIVTKAIKEHQVLFWLYANDFGLSILDYLIYSFNLFIYSSLKIIVFKFLV